ncbi:hypothetical protein ACLOJK_017618 [Asimina triloba]
MNRQKPLFETPPPPLKAVENGKKRMREKRPHEPRQISVTNQTPTFMADQPPSLQHIKSPPSFLHSSHLSLSLSHIRSLPSFLPFSMDSKPHLLLSTLLLLFLFHPQLISSTCIQREYLHLIHTLLPPPSSQQQPNPQPDQQQQPPPQPTPPADQQQQPDPQPDQQQQATPSLESASSTLDTALADPSPTVSPAVDAAIKDICSKTDYADVCITSLTGTPLEGDTLDASAALQMLIKSAVRHGNAALVEAQRLAGDSSLPDFTLQNMKVCQGTYSDALDDFQKAADAAVARDMGTLNTMLSAAMTDYDTCSDGFMEMPGASPLIDYDNKLSHMTSNCLAVATLLK